jgi:Helix-turn-helix domain
MSRGVKRAKKVDERMPYKRMFPNNWMDLLTPQALSIQERLVWRVLNEYQWTNDVAFPSLKTLSKICGIGERQVIRITQSLERKGLLIIVHNKKVGRTNTYTVLLPDDLQEPLRGPNEITQEEDREKVEEEGCYVLVDDPEV